VVEIGGRRTTMRQEMIKEQEEIGRLLEAEKERKRRLGGERSLQTDDGSVLDIMVCILYSSKLVFLFSSHELDSTHFLFN
jgi:hypothetical protein